MNKAVVEKDAAQLKVKADISASCTVVGYMPVSTDTVGDLAKSLIFQSGGFRLPDGTLQTTAAVGGTAGLSATSLHLRRVVPT